MGGLAGHMTHLYGDNSLKLKELFKIIDGVATGEISYNEKADGQNIFVTYEFDTDRVLLARNKSDVSKGGRTHQEIRRDYLEKDAPQVAMIFGDGGEAIEKIIRSIPRETLNLIFNDKDMPKTYINAEIIIENKFNILYYGTNHIQFHELQVFGDVSPLYKNKNAGLVKLNEKFEKLINDVNKTFVETKNRKWSVAGPQFLPSAKERLSDQDYFNFTELSNSTKQRLLELFSKNGLSKENTIGDLVASKLKNEVLVQLNVPSNIISLVSDFLLFGSKSLTSLDSSPRKANNKLKALMLSSGLTKDQVDRLTASKYKSYQNLLKGKCYVEIKNIIHQYSLSILSSVESLLSRDARLTSKVLKDALRDIEEVRTQLRINWSHDAKKLETYEAKFNRELELLGDIEDFNASMEGIVMRYTREDGTPMLYKMTGRFAPANQLLGAAGFETKERLLNRSLKNNSQKKVNESRLKSLTKSVIRKHILS